MREKPDRLLTIAEVVEKYGVPRGYLYSWIKRDYLHCVKAGKRSVLIYERSLLKFLADHEVKPRQRKRKAASPDQVSGDDTASRRGF